MNPYVTRPLFLLLFLAAIATGAPIPKEVEHARISGAHGCITLRIVDSTGHAVVGARVKGGFYNPRKSGQTIDGLTDTNGCYTATGFPTVDLGYRVTKEGHYASEGTHMFHNPKIQPLILDGRWQPWNPTNMVVLKERRDPVPMIARRVNIPIPVQGEPLGFDLEKGDWVVPHGRGDTADIHIQYVDRIDDWQNFRLQLNISCAGESDGFQVLPKDTWSEFVSTHHAPDSGYVQDLELVTDRTTTTITERKSVSSDDYIVFRVRSRKDENGRVTEAWYGKIYGPVEFGALSPPETPGEERKDKRGAIIFLYYLNPSSLDRNIEFDPARNLAPFSPRDRVTRP